MTYSIRTLSTTDADVLRDLLSVFGEAFDDEETYCGNQPEPGYLEKLLGGDSFIAIAALCGREVVGGLAAYELKKFEQRRSEIYIYDLAIAEAHRRKGLATKLMRNLSVRRCTALCI